MGHSERNHSQVERYAAEAIVTLAGFALIAISVLANREWLDRHFLPSFFMPPRMFLLIATIIRFIFAALGVAFVFLLRARVGHLIARIPPGRFFADIARMLLAVVLALGTSEMILRLTFAHATQERPPSEEPRRRHHDHIGWVFEPSRTGYEKVSGREIEYAFDAAGYRVRQADHAVDPNLPTIIFAGESVMAGHGLNWEESIPAQVEMMLKTQCANIAVHGYATDQAYLRLLDELPRFRRPIAIVSLFGPILFDRNLDDDGRPHLGPGLVWVPAKQRWRIAAVAKWLVPYRSNETIERGIAMTREVLRATTELARAHGAVPLIVVPQFAPELPIERMLRKRILDDGGLPYVWVELDPSWRFPGDGHPDPRAAHAIAVALASRLAKLNAFGPGGG